MSKSQNNFGYFFKILIILTSFLLLDATAAEDNRIEDELSSSITIIPLKKAIGEDSYNDAIGSGKYRYVGSSKCRLCHRKFFIGRKKDPHDHAMESLEKGAYKDNPKCLICHATGYGTPTGFISTEKTPRLSNVQCEGCHGPGNLHIKMAKDKKAIKIKKFVSGGFLAGADSPIRLKRMCSACHTKRWEKAYHDLDKAYDKYKKANPNAKQKSR